MDREDINHLVSLKRDGHTYQELSTQFGVSRQRCQRLFQRENNGYQDELYLLALEVTNSRQLAGTIRNGLNRKRIYTILDFLNTDNHQLYSGYRTGETMYGYLMEMKRIARGVEHA